MGPKLSDPSKKYRRFCCSQKAINKTKTKAPRVAKIIDGSQRHSSTIVDKKIIRAEKNRNLSPCKEQVITSTGQNSWQGTGDS